MKKVSTRRIELGKLLKIEKIRCDVVDCKEKILKYYFELINSWLPCETFFTHRCVLDNYKFHYRHHINSNAPKFFSEFIVKEDANYEVMEDVNYEEKEDFNYEEDTFII